MKRYSQTSHNNLYFTNIGGSNSSSSINQKRFSEEQQNLHSPNQLLPNNNINFGSFAEEQLYALSSIQKQNSINTISNQPEQNFSFQKQPSNKKALVKNNKI